MTVDEMRAKAKQDKCGRCFGAVDVRSFGVKSIGCILGREKHWECAGPYTQKQIVQIIVDEDEDN